MVEYIEYKGKKYPFVYNYYAISRLRSKVDELDNAEILDYSVYYSIEAGCEEMDVPFTIKKGDIERELTVKDVAFMIGKVTPEYINSLLEKFTAKGEDGKKKMS